MKELRNFSIVMAGLVPAIPLGDAVLS